MTVRSNSFFSKIITRVLASFEDKRLRAMVMYHNSFITHKGLKTFLKSPIQESIPNSFLTHFSLVKRSLEIHERDLLLKEVLLTCYFTKKPDPIQGTVRASADIKYIAPWYESVVKHKLMGIVIHDGLEKEFIDTYQNEFVQFRKYEAGNYSIFEERWIAYLLFLEASKNIEKLFCTDANDVYITSNPFSYATSEDTLYVGRDNANRVRHTGWLLEELRIFEEDASYKVPESFFYQPVYNAGILGGSRKVIFFFITKMIDLLIKTQTNFHKDMTLLNIVIHQYFAPIISYSANEAKLNDPNNDHIASHSHLVTGHPLNSEFKRFDIGADAIFIHK